MEAFVLMTLFVPQANWFTDRLGDVKTIVGGHIDDFSRSLYLIIFSSHGPAGKNRAN